jgi:O-antigen ligase
MAYRFVARREFSFSTNLLQIPLFGLIVVGLIQLLPLRGGQPICLISPYLARFRWRRLKRGSPLFNSFRIQFFCCRAEFYQQSKTPAKNRRNRYCFRYADEFFRYFAAACRRRRNLRFASNNRGFTFGSYVNRHHFAGFLEMPIGLTLALLFGKATANDKRIFLVVAALIMGMAIILSGSRGALISLFAVLVFIITANLLKNKTDDEEDFDGEAAGTNFRRNLTLIGGGLVVIFGLFGAVIMLGADDALLRSVGLGVSGEDASNGRTHFWSIALKIISDYPILGAGLDSFGTVFTHYDTWNGNFRIEQAHNDYLQIWQTPESPVLFAFCRLSFCSLKKASRLLQARQTISGAR